MSCFPELTYSVYVDGGLSAEDALQVDRHLARCVRCRALVEAMRVEDLTLRQLLQESGTADSSSSEGHFALAGVGMALLGVVAASAALRAAFERARSAFAGVDWLNPTSPAFYLNLFFSAGTYLFQGGVSMLTSMIQTVAVPLLVVSALVFGAWVVLGKRRATSALLVLMFALGPISARALEARKGPHASVAASETVDDSLLVSGDTVTIDGVVTGNLIAAGRRITVRGTVKGDVICWGQTIDLDGTIEGNVYCAGQTTNLRGSVSRSVIACGQRILVPSEGRVEGDVLVFGGETGVDGGVGRDVSAFAGVADVRGSVGRHLKAHVGRLNLMAPATVGGDLTVHVGKKEDVQVASGVTIAGRSETKVSARKSRYSRPSFYVWKVVGLVAALITGLFLVWWHPGFFAPGGMGSGKAVLRRLGVGFLALVATPVAVAIAGLTLIGLPLALLMLALWLFGLYAAKILVAGAIGQRLLPAPAGFTARFAQALFLGLVIVLVAVNLPFVGGLVAPLLMLVGLGMFVSQWRGLLRRPPAARPSGPVS